MRSRFLKVIGRIFACLAALVIVGAITVYGLSEREVRRTYDVPLTGLAPVISPDLIEGERLARISGCVGCHGLGDSGQVFVWDEPGIARLVAGDLTRIVLDYSDEELERVVRKGVRRDGKTVWAMPSAMYAHLTDDDLAAIIAYVRSLEPRGGPPAEVRLRAVGRLGVVAKQFRPGADEVSQLGPVDHDASAPHARGRYLAMISCTECHGSRLQGSPDGFIPGLRMVAAYSPADFSRLMREGIAKGERELALMSQVARSRFFHFTDGEIEELHGYLVTLMDAETAASPPAGH